MNTPEFSPSRDDDGPQTTASVLFPEPETTSVSALTTQAEEVCSALRQIFEQSSSRCVKIAIIILKV